MNKNNKPIYEMTIDEHVSLAIDESDKYLKEVGGYKLLERINREVYRVNKYDYVDKRSKLRKMWHRITGQVDPEFSQCLRECNRKRFLYRQSEKTHDPEKLEKQNEYLRISKLSDEHDDRHLIKIEDPEDRYGYRIWRTSKSNNVYLIITASRLCD